MLVVMKHGAKPAEIDAVVKVIEEMGYEARPMPGAQRTAVGLVGNDGRVDASRIEALRRTRSSPSAPASKWAAAKWRSSRGRARWRARSRS
jgi:hypothetical protein